MPGSKTPRSTLVRDFGAHIASRRRRLGLSQMEVADIVGISQESLSRLESGLAAPKFHRLEKIADALQCSVSDLFVNITDIDKNKGRFFAELIHPLPLIWQDTILRMVLHMTHTIQETSQGEANSADGFPNIKNNK